MEPRKIPEGAVQVGSHWEWQEVGLTVQGWADENGYLHREGAPAVIWYLKDGHTIRKEFWYLHGQLHREEGPARIWYHEDGHTIQSEFWWLHGDPTEPLYPQEVYQDLQTQIGHEAMWGLPGNLIPLLSAFC